MSREMAAGVDTDSAKSLASGSRSLSGAGRRRFTGKGLLRSAKLLDAYLICRREAAHFRVYLKVFGVRRGIRNYATLYRPRGTVGSIARISLARSEFLLIRRRTVDTQIFEDIFLRGQYDLEVPPEPSQIIDGGAHIGCASVYLARKYPDAKILAIEPSDSNFDLLSRNVAGYPNVIAIRAALWGAPSVLSIENPGADSWAFRMADVQGQDPAGVVGLTIGELRAWTGDKPIDILKLDVEGAECGIFADTGGTWLESVRCLAIELHDRFVPGCSESLQKATASQDFVRTEKGECVILTRPEHQEAHGALRSFQPRMASSPR